MPHPISAIARIAGDRAIDQPRELAAFGARSKRVQAVARRISGERRAIVEPRTTSVRRSPSIGDSESRPAPRSACRSRCTSTSSDNATPARRAGEQFADSSMAQKIA